MFEVQGVNFKLGVLGESFKRGKFRKTITLDVIIAFINSKNLDPKLRAEMLKIAKKYPANALPQFKKDFHKHLVAIKKR